MGAVSNISNSVSKAIGTDGSGGGLLNEPLVKNVVVPGAAAYFGAPYLSGAMGVTGALGTSAIGAGVGGLTSSALGGNAMSGALAGAGGAYFGMPSAAGATGANAVITSGPFAGATAAQLAAANGVGGMSTLDGILSGASKYAPLIGAVGGALASGDTSSTQTADKSPWGPAQEWMKANLGLGQTMQAKYAANPFNRQQQQAYNNSATGGNQFRTTANSLISQMGQRQAYNRNAPNQVTPYSFGASNLGMTSMPFAGVK